MRILLASSEVHPYSKTGGLADMVGALAKTLARGGDHVQVVTPLYRGIGERFPAVRREPRDALVPLDSALVPAQFWQVKPEARLTIWFVDQPLFYDRASLYGKNDNDYPDNAARFIFLSKCVAHLARQGPVPPDVVHVNDWQVALVPLLLRHQQLREGWGSPPPTCLTIHNLAFQGNFPATRYPLTNLPWDYFHPNGAEFYGQFNCLKAGICYADAITTVSPRYAHEITTPHFGCGLDGVLRHRQTQLTGILNGVDYDEWDPARDPFLHHHFTADDLSGKARNKAELQVALGLPPAPHVPLFGTVSRLTDQKGIDIELGALEEMLATNLQFVLLGTGAPVYEAAFADLARRHPQKVTVRTGYDHALAHRIEAACDFFLMPSRFEPSGLNQMYSLRYGTVPIVRTTGGLDNSVIDITEDGRRANGIKFLDCSAHALVVAIRKALALYHEPDLLSHFRRNGMTADFSWERSAAIYRAVYARIAR